MNPEVLAESTDPDFEMEYIDIGNVSLEHGIGQLQAFRFYDAPSRARKIVRKGDTLISTVRTYLKAIAYIEEDHTNWIASTGFAILRPDVGIDPRFLYRVAQASPFVEAVVASSTGVSYPAINPSTLGSIEIPVPDLETQKAIAEFLDRETARIDQLIERKQRMVELLVEKSSSLIASIITQGLDESTPTMPSGIGWLGAIPSHWKMKRLKYIGKAVIGLTYSPDDVVSDDSGTGVLRATNLQDGNITLDDLVRVTTPIPDRLRIRADDIIICSRNGSRALIGKNATANINHVGLTFGAFTTVFRTRFYRYVGWVLNSPLFAYQAGAFLTSTINQLTTHTLNNFEVPFPPEPEQIAIADSLQKETALIDSARSKVLLSIARLHELRSALITAAVAGQIDVATWGKRGTTDRQPGRQKVRA
jgi:type I restriction enzyme S subunit